MPVSQSIPRNCVDLILSSITRTRNEYGLQSSFFFGKPGVLIWDRRMGVEIYYQEKDLTTAALYIRKSGPVFLRYLAIEDLWSMLQEFIRENFWYLADETYFAQFEGTFAEFVSEKTKNALADVLAQSRIFLPRSDLTAFPLATVQVLSAFDSDPFFLVSADSLRGERMPTGLRPRNIVSAQFPPLADWEGRKEVPLAWLGIRSPAISASRKMKAIILGALALTPTPSHRHMFSGRTVFGGACTISDRGITTSWGDSHTPPLMNDIVITDTDHVWLRLLSQKLVSGEKPVRRQLKALEYYYRAWALEPSERFPVLCMTLDAVFGDMAYATQAVIEGVRAILGQHVAGPRLRLLMELRASVIHGGAPDVYDSSKYGRYYEAYGTDPVRDMELVVARCLTRIIFDQALVEHPNPNAKTIEEGIKAGRLPKQRSAAILNDEGEESGAHPL